LVHWESALRRPREERGIDRSPSDGLISAGRQIAYERRHSACCCPSPLYPSRQGIHRDVTSHGESR
jgi:hypothetical protein